MTTPILHDGRTDAEKRYDELKSGAAYVKPEAPSDQEYEQLLDSVWSRVTAIIADADDADRIIAEHRAALSVSEILALPDDHPINVAANARMEAMIAAELAELAATDDNGDDDEEDTRCTACTYERDCPACQAKYEADRVQVIARAAAAPSATERAEILLENDETLSGDQIFDLLLEDRLVSFTWYRCIDWVLWRQAHGKPIKRCGADDDCPAAIDARFSAARDYNSNRANWNPDADGHMLCIGNMIKEWERTPEEQAKIQRSNQIMVEIFELLETA